MGVVLALPQLVIDVRASLVADAARATVDPGDPVAAVPVYLGWREPARRGATPRVVFVPGDDRSGVASADVSRPESIAKTPARVLWTLRETWTAYLETRDTEMPEDELAQYVAARLLLDNFLRALHHAATTNVAVTGIAWVIEKTTRRHGAALRVTGWVKAPVPDLAHALAPDDIAAAVTSYLHATSVDGGELDTVPTPEDEDPPEDP